MFNANSFSPISTSFASAGTSMMPSISTGSMASNIKTMSPFDTMREVFIDIKDSINNVGLKTLTSFTMLQGTLITGFTMLGDSLMTLVNIAVKDLELRKVSTGISEGNEYDQDQDDSLSQGDKSEGKGILTDSFKSKAVETLKKMIPSTLLGKAILLGVGIAGFAMSIDGVAKVIGKIAEFTSKEVVPRVMKLGENTKEYFTNLFDGLYGENGFFPVFMDEFTNIKDAVESGDYKAAVVGVKDLLVRSTISAVSVLGTSIVGIIKAGLGIIDPNADTSDIDKLIKFFKDLPENATKELSEQAKEYQKVLDEKGFGAAQLVALRQTYDNIIGRGLNGISNIFGVALKPINEDLGNYLMDADYTSKGIKSAFQVSMKNLGLAMEKSRNGISRVINDIIDDMNKYLPDFMKIDGRMIITKDGKDVSTYVNNEGMTVPMYSEGEMGKDINVLGKKEQKPIDEIMRDQILGDGSAMYNGNKFSFEKQPTTNLELSDMMNNKDSRMKVKTEEIKTLAAEVIVPLAKSSTNIVADNKQITTNNSSSNTTIASNQRVDSIESSSNALLQYFRN